MGFIRTFSHVYCAPHLGKLEDSVHSPKVLCAHLCPHTLHIQLCPSRAPVIYAWLLVSPAICVYFCCHIMPASVTGPLLQLICKTHESVCGWRQMEVKRRPSSGYCQSLSWRCLVDVRGHAVWIPGAHLIRQHSQCSCVLSDTSFMTVSRTTASQAWGLRPKCKS
jgi:hypothetical protein